MRAILAASLGSLCTAALVVPLASPASAQPPTAADHTSDQRVSFLDNASSGEERAPRTKSLPLTTRSAGERAPGSSEGTSAAQGAVGLDAREVTPFSMLGVVWDDAQETLDARVEVRTRATGTTDWSEWVELENHTEDAPDQSAAERADRQTRGSTAPLWVGDSDAVEVRLHPGKSVEAQPLPAGLRVALIDPGGDHAPATSSRPGTAASTSEASSPVPGAVFGGASDGAEGSRLASPKATASSAANARLADLGAQVIPPLGREETQRQSSVVREASAQTMAAEQAKAPIGPRPGIVTRAGWNANESWREKEFAYTTTVKSAFVHHTAASNNYTCGQAPSVIRGIYQYHVRTLGWRDIGYNFLVDKCGTIYEGRAGGVARAVLGAHTYGFNSNTTGIAVLGSYGSTAPSKDAVEGVSKLIAWKLGLHGLNPSGSVTLTSGGGKYPAGTKVNMRAVAGHRDGFATECPGAKLYNSLGTVRSLATKLHGR